MCRDMGVHQGGMASAAHGGAPGGGVGASGGAGLAPSLSANEAARAHLPAAGAPAAAASARGQAAPSLAGGEAASSFQAGGGDGPGLQHAGSTQGACLRSNVLPHGSMRGSTAIWAAAWPHN